MLMKAFPKQVKFIVGNEACERFSYYGMRSILVIFMTTQLAIPADRATATYHLFVSGCYLLPLLGAYLSDRYLGKYKTILWLSIVYCAGHGVLSAWENEAGLYLGLSLIALGSGGIKPCVSAYVGDQFTKENSHLISKIYDYFYFSINFGSVFSSLLIPYTLTHFGSRIAFGIPGILMAIATLIFWSGRNHYIDVPPTAASSEHAGFMPVLAYAIAHRRERRPGQGFFEVARARYSAADVEAAEAASAVFRVFITVSAFWALFDQSGSTWVLQAKRMAPEFLGMHWEASQMQAMNPFLVMILIPLFTGVIYPAIERLGIRMSALRRMSAGMLLTAASFAVVAILQGLIEGGSSVNIMWQFVPYLIITCSEVMVSITGLEFAYTQAPRSMKSTIMSFWLLTVFVGNFLAAGVAELLHYTPLEVASSAYFWSYTGMMLVVALLFAWSASRYRMRNYVESGGATAPAGVGADGGPNGGALLSPSTAG